MASFVARQTLADPPNEAIEFTVSFSQRIRQTFNPCVAVSVSTGSGWPTQNSTAEITIIPEARGFGMSTVAGSGRGAGQGTSTLHRVTNLNNSGAGSLRAALTASGPRTVVFETSGTIDLGEDKIKIDNPYLTVAGQTAPSPGIQVTKGFLTIRASNVLIQHMRFRVGAFSSGCDNADGLQIEINAAGDPDITDIIIDHCSMNFSTDEATAIWRDCGDITFRRCIFAFPLKNSCHSKGPHGYGPIAGGDGGDGRHNITWVGNLFAHCEERGGPLTRSPNCTIVNNFFYNWQLFATGFEKPKGGMTPENSNNNVESNSYKAGVDSSGREIWLLPGSASIDCDTKIYLNDNITTLRSDSDQWDRMISNSSSCTKAQINAGVRIASAFPEGLVLAGSSDIEDLVTTSVGPRPSDRDALDQRAIDDATNGTGSIIDSPSDVGGMPSPATNTATFDDPINPDEIAASGYTKREEHLQQLALGVE